MAWEAPNSNILSDKQATVAIKRLSRKFETYSKKTSRTPVIWDWIARNLRSDFWKKRWAAYFQYASIKLSSRYLDKRRIRDIDKAIIAARLAAELLPEGHTLKPAYWSNVSNRLHRRYQRTGDLKDLDEAIKTGATAVVLLLDSDPRPPARYHK